MALVLALLTTTLAAADAARARKTLEERLVPLTPAELLQRAARDDVEVLGLLLEAGVRPDAAEPGGFRAGWTALHHAASRRDGKALTLLLKAGAPVNAQAKNGMTALCVAVGEGYPSNVADLLAARADATLVCRDGRTALHEATARAGEPRPSIVTVLLKAGARIDAVDAAGQTALMLAAGRAQGLANVEVLLSGGAKPDLAARNGRTALHEAVAARSPPDRRGAPPRGSRPEPEGRGRRHAAPPGGPSGRGRDPGDPAQVRRRHEGEEPPGRDAARHGPQELSRPRRGCPARGVRRGAGRPGPERSARAQAMRPWRALPRATLVLLALAGVVLVVAGCAVLDDGPSETPRQRADRALRDIRESKDPEVRMRAAETLGDLKLPEAVDPLLQALRDPDPRVRRRVADALEQFEDAAPAIVPSLTAAAVAETNAPARVEMGWTLKKLKAAPDTWVPAFRAGLADPDPLTRHNAAVGLVGQAPALDIFPASLRGGGDAVRTGTDRAPPVDRAESRRAEQRPPAHPAAAGRPQDGEPVPAGPGRAGARPPEAAAARGHRAPRRRAPRSGGGRANERGLHADPARSAAERGAGR